MPEEKKAKGKLKKYKLAHSRLLTCYSALLYLLAVYRERNSVTPQDAASMIALSPTERLERLQELPSLSSARDGILGLLSRYEQFLETTNAAEAELINRFLDKAKSREYMEAANRFGDLVFDVLRLVGDGTRLFRFLVV